MKNEAQLALAIVSAFVVFSAPINANAQDFSVDHLENQGFEPLYGWTSTGNVTGTSVADVGAWTVFPHQTQMAQLESQFTDAQSLDAFFGLEAGTIDTAVFGDVTDGAGIKQSFTGHAGETFTQYWEFVTRDYSPFNDSAFVVVNGEVTVLASVENGGIEVGNFGHSDWQSFNYTLPADGTYTIGFGVVNVTDTAFTSALFLDNQAGITVPIPEPETYAMFLAGLGLMGFIARGRKTS